MTQAPVKRLKKRVSGTRSRFQIDTPGLPSIFPIRAPGCSPSSGQQPASEKTTFDSAILRTDLDMFSESLPNFFSLPESFSMPLPDNQLDYLRGICFGSTCLRPAIVPSSLKTNIQRAPSYPPVVQARRALRSAASLLLLPMLLRFFGGCAISDYLIIINIIYKI